MGSGRAAIERMLHAHASSATEVFAGVAPLEAIVAHAHDGHWHFVTLGLSELGEKTSPDPARSGWGLELTMRAPGIAGAAPRWSVRVLQQLASYVDASRNPFAPGHHMTLGAALDADAPALGALAFAEDPELGALETPNGRVRFVQAVGLHADEEVRAGRGSVAAFLEALATREPLLVTHPDRASVVDDPAFAAAFAQTAGTASAITEVVRWTRRGFLGRRLAIVLGPAALIRRELPALLDDLIATGRAIRLRGEGRLLEIAIGERTVWRANDARLAVELSRESVRALGAFLAGREATFADPHDTNLTFHLEAAHTTS